MTFDAVAPGDVARVAEKSKNENLDASEIYTQKPYYDSSPSRDLASLRKKVHLVIDESGYLSSKIQQLLYQC